MELTSGRVIPAWELSLAPLQAFRAEGGVLQPGQLLSVYPPYCVDNANRARSFRAIATADRLAFLSSLASQLRELPDGGAVRFNLEPPGT